MQSILSPRVSITASPTSCTTEYWTFIGSPFFSLLIDEHKKSTIHTKGRNSQCLWLLQYCILCKRYNMPPGEHAYQFGRHFRLSFGCWPKTKETGRQGKERQRQTPPPPLPHLRRNGKGVKQKTHPPHHTPAKK